MKTAQSLLRHIDALREPKHLFILPDWADPIVLDKTIKQGHLTDIYEKRDENGALQLVMGLQITDSGRQLLQSHVNWSVLATRTALAGTGFMVMNAMLLYWA